MYTSNSENLEIKFMKENNLNALCFLNPNGEYFIRNLSLKNPFSAYSYLYTDGLKSIECNLKNNENIITIRNATWVLHIQVHFKKDIKHENRILYTKSKKDFINIKLPDNM